MNWFKNENNLKGIIIVTICIILLAQAAKILLSGSEELQKLFLLEIFGIVSLLVGYYWGSSKGSKDKDEMIKKPEAEKH
jgi:predicted acyltransferase